MSPRTHPLSRILLALSVLALLSAYFLPIWQIQLWAPQYPEGLNMKIWINKLSGAFDIINGLNHYIGMAMIKEEMFPEFKFMIYLLGALIALGLFAVIMGTRKWLWIYVVTLAVGGIVGLADYYRWGYEYGHNLDPHAAIQVPGMTYQPPLLGYKNLLNFTAYSGPDIAGGIMLASGGVAGLILIWEHFIRGRRNRKAALQSKPSATPAKSAPAAVMLTAAALALAACDPQPEPIRYGTDQCSECKMTITDQRFGAEIVTTKGKVFKFDDTYCAAECLRKEVVSEKDVHLLLVSDFRASGRFISAKDAFFLKSENLKSPMRSDCAAFSSTAERDAVKNQLGGGQEYGWEQVKKVVP
jgi:copper chaperone NosL